MKRFLFITFFISAVTFSNGQVIRLYCFEQPVNGGAFQKEEIIAGDSVNKQYDVPNQTNSRFFLFAEVKKGSTVTFNQVWIKGNKYSFIAHPLKELPFVLTTNNGGNITIKDTLIKKSHRSYIHLKNLVLTENTQVKNLPNSQIIKNDVMVFYHFKNTKINSKLKSVTQIRPLFTQ